MNVADNAKQMLKAIKRWFNQPKELRTKISQWERYAAHLEALLPPNVLIVDGNNTVVSDASLSDPLSAVVVTGNNVRIESLFSTGKVIISPAARSIYFGRVFIEEKDGRPTAGDYTIGVVAITDGA